jgi:hypothetical protein
MHLSYYIHATHQLIMRVIRRHLTHALSLLSRRARPARELIVHLKSARSLYRGEAPRALCQLRVRPAAPSHRIIIVDLSIIASRRPTRHRIAER